MAGRALTAGEAALAQEVFGAAVELGRVRLHGGGFGGFAVTLGSNIFLPPHLAQHDFSLAGAGGQALLVHELVHVWQFQTRPVGTLMSWARTVLEGGYGPGLPGYRYGLPLAAFAELALERQASVVEHAFLLRAGLRTPMMPQGLRWSDVRGATPFPITGR